MAVLRRSRNGATIHDTQPPPTARGSHLRSKLSSCLTSRDTPWKSCFTRSRALRILIGMTQDVAHLLKDPHLQERGFFTGASVPGGGEILVPGAPFRMSRTPAVSDRPAPLRGQHNAEVF